MLFRSGNQGVQGPQGDQGVQGPQGDQGVQGPQGDQGVQGPQGDQGVQGPQGDQGVQGPQGDQGVQGPQGPQGDQGVQGPQGDQGVQGPQGDQGVQGPQGDIGASGGFSTIAQSSMSGGGNAPAKITNGYAFGYKVASFATSPATYTGSGELMIENTGASWPIYQLGVFNPMGVTRSNTRAMRLIANITIHGNKSVTNVLRTCHFIVERINVLGPNIAFNTIPVTAVNEYSSVDQTPAIVSGSTFAHNFQISDSFTMSAFNATDLISVGFGFSEVGGDFVPADFDFSLTWKIVEEGPAS